MSEQNQQPSSTILTELLAIAVELWYALEAIYAADLVPDGDDGGTLLTKAEAIIGRAHTALNQPTTPFILTNRRALRRWRWCGAQSAAH